MPELPEVEVVKLYLEQKLLHQTITKLDILTPKSFIGQSSQVVGQKIIKFSRIGKQLSLYLSNNLILLIHLKMTGQLIYDGFMLGHPTPTINPKSTRLIFTFNNNSKLYFNDQRKFGWVKLLSRTELAEAQSGLGLDIFDSKFTPAYLYSRLQKSHRPIKTILLDQHYFAGIGNIYACDALFLAGIHPSSPSNKIQKNKALKLHHSLLSIMHQSVSAGGSTARDKKYLRPDGTSGQNQFFFRVYQRKREPCLKCGTKIEYLKIGSRGTFFCPHCQPSKI